METRLGVARATEGRRPGRGRKAVERHRSRGKMTARERRPARRSRERLSRAQRLAAWELYDGQAPGAGIVTGIGVVEGQECVIVANDATVKGGTYFPMTVKKHLRAKSPRRTTCPASTSSTRAGRSSRCRTTSSPTASTSTGSSSTRRGCRRRDPSDRGGDGPCTAGGAYVPAMSDETIIVRGTGTIFIGGPPLVKAATGQEVTAEELGGAAYTRRSGVADHYATSDERARDRPLGRPAPPPPARRLGRRAAGSPSPNRRSFTA